MIALFKNNYFLILILAFVAFLLWAGMPIWHEKVTSYINFLSTMQITSNAFEDRGNIPSEYTCDGRNVNPPLSFKGVPEEAQSLVLIVDDPDAPVGTFVHWTIWNISTTTGEIPEGSVPSGATEGVTSFGSQGYGGPCPPSGTHRYFFKLFALDTMLDLSNDTKNGDLLSAMKGHVLADAELMGNYKKQENR